MIRVHNVQLRYDQAGRDTGRAASVSRRALEILSERVGADRAPANIDQLRISVRVPRGASDEVVAERIAAAIAERLPSTRRGE